MNLMNCKLNSSTSNGLTLTISSPPTFIRASNFFANSCLLTFHLSRPRRSTEWELFEIIKLNEYSSCIGWISIIRHPWLHVPECINRSLYTKTKDRFSNEMKQLLDQNLTTNKYNSSKENHLVHGLCEWLGTGRLQSHLWPCRELITQPRPLIMRYLPFCVSLVEHTIVVIWKLSLLRVNPSTRGRLYLWCPAEPLPCFWKDSSSSLVAGNSRYLLFSSFLVSSYRKYPVFLVNLCNWVRITIVLLYVHF